MDAVSASLQLINDDPRQVYAITYDSILSAWRVLHLVEVQHESYRDECLYRLTPYSVNHNALTSALADAIKLKSVA